MVPRDVRMAREWLDTVHDCAEDVRRLARRRAELEERACHPGSSGFDVITTHTPGDGMSRARALADFECDNAALLRELAGPIRKFREVYSLALAWPAPVPRGAEVSRAHDLCGETYQSIAARMGTSPSTARRLRDAFCEFVAAELELAA